MWQYKFLNYNSYNLTINNKSEVQKVNCPLAELPFKTIRPANVT